MDEKGEKRELGDKGDAFVLKPARKFYTKQKSIRRHPHSFAGTIKFLNCVGSWP